MMIYPCLRVGVSVRDLASELASLELEFKLPVTRMWSGIGNRDLNGLIIIVRRHGAGRPLMVAFYFQSGRLET
jgi:hypothetical protein